MPLRSSDRSEEKCYFRSERFYNLNSEWFFATREGDQGPFRTREDAERQLGHFLTERDELDHFQRSREGGVLHRSDPKSDAVKLEILPLDAEASI